ncbi:MAG: polymer-forming cytoskeletal protein [Gemmatimonadota bacterium]
MAAHTHLALLAAALLLPGALRAQTNAPAPCPAREPAGLSSAHAALLKRASQDPIIGCGALDATHKAGDFLVAAGDTVRGNLVVLDGTLRVTGTVTGTAMALNGAVVIDSSGHVLGDVISAEHGAAIAPSGRVDGELRTLDAIEPLVPEVQAGAVGGTITSLTRTAAWFGILILLGIGVLINSGDAMQRVTTALQSGFARNVLVGLLAQMALLPVLVLTCVLLALTLIGILLIPFAIVAYVVAVLGLLVLGGLGAVQMVGAGIAPRRRAASERGARLQALVTGMLLLSVPWLIAAALTSIPILSAAVGTLALGITWVALTAGLGATLRTRGGTRSHEDPWGVRRPAPSGTPLPVEAPKAEWLTPTPLTGVVAVKRPTTSGSRSAR